MKARNPIWILLIVEMKVRMAGLFCGPFKSVSPASLNTKDHSIFINNIYIIYLTGLWYRKKILENHRVLNDHLAVRKS